MCGQDECLFFSVNVNDYLQGSTFNAELMALDWCTSSDGLTIFPKLPVHLRLHMEKWQRGERAASHLRGMETNYDVLMGDLRAAEPSIMEEAPNAAAAPDTVSAAPHTSPRVVVVAAHLPMPSVAHAAVFSAPPMRVGRMVVGAATPPALVKRKRRDRVCQLCWEHGTAIEFAAASHPDTKHYGRHCPLFFSTGERKVHDPHP